MFIMSNVSWIIRINWIDFSYNSLRNYYLVWTWLFLLPRIFRVEWYNPVVLRNGEPDPNGSVVTRAPLPRLKCRHTKLYLIVNGGFLPNNFGNFTNIVRVRESVIWIPRSIIKILVSLGKRYDIALRHPFSRVKQRCATEGTSRLKTGS